MWDLKHMPPFLQPPFILAIKENILLLSLPIVPSLFQKQIFPFPFTWHDVRCCREEQARAQPGGIWNPGNLVTLPHRSLQTHKRKGANTARHPKPDKTCRWEREHKGGNQEGSIVGSQTLSNADHTAVCWMIWLASRCRKKVIPGERKLARLVISSLRRDAKVIKITTTIRMHIQDLTNYLSASSVLQIANGMTVSLRT
jgi:hypothetical protein